MIFRLNKRGLKTLPTTGWVFPFLKIGQIGKYLQDKRQRYHRFKLKGKSVTGYPNSTHVYFLHKNSDVVRCLKNEEDALDLSNYDRALKLGGGGAKFFISADQDNTALQWDILEDALKLAPALNRSVHGDKKCPHHSRLDATKRPPATRLYDLIAEQAELAVNEVIAQIYEREQNAKGLRAFIKSRRANNEVNLVTEYGHAVTHVFVRDFLGIDVPIKSKRKRAKGFASWIKFMFANLFVNPGGRIALITWASKLITRKYVATIKRSYKNPKEGSLLGRLKTIERTKLHKYGISQDEYQKLVVNILMEVGGSFQYLTGEAFSNILKSIDEDHSRANGHQSIALSNEALIDKIGQIKQNPKAYINEYLRLNSPTQFIFRTVKSNGFSVTGDVNDPHTIAAPGDLVCLLTGIAGRDSDVFPDPELIITDRSCPRYLHFGGPDDEPADYRPSSHHPCFGQYWAQTILESMLDGLLKFPGLRVEKTGNHKGNSYIAQYNREPKQQNFVTIISKIPEGYCASAQYKLKEWGNPIRPVRVKDRAQECQGSLYDRLSACRRLHFMSAHIVEGKENAKGVLRKFLERSKFISKDAPLKYEPDYLLLELSVDGCTEDAIDELSDNMWEELYAFYEYCGMFNPETTFEAEGNLSDKDKKIRITNKLHHDAYSLVQSPWPHLFTSKAVTGLPFTGTAGLSCARIKAEAELAEQVDEIIKKPFEFRTAHARLYEVRKELFQKTPNDADAESFYEKEQSLSKLKWVLGGSKAPAFAEDFDDPWVKRIVDQKSGFLDNLGLVWKLFPRILFIPMIFVFLLLSASLQTIDIDIAADKSSTALYYANAGTIFGYLFISFFLGNILAIALRHILKYGLGRVGEMFFVSTLFLFFITFFDHQILLEPRINFLELGRSEIKPSGKDLRPHPIFTSGKLYILILGLTLGVVMSLAIIIKTALSKYRKRGYVFSQAVAFLIMWSLICVITYQHAFWILPKEFAEPGHDFVENRFPNTSLMDLIFYPMQYSFMIVLTIHAYVKSFHKSDKGLISPLNVGLFLIFASSILLTSFIPLTNFTSLIITVLFIVINVILVPFIAVFLLFALYQWVSPSTAFSDGKKRGGALTALILTAVFSGIINLNAVPRNLVIKLTGQPVNKFKPIESSEKMIEVFINYINALFNALPLSIIIIIALVYLLIKALNLSEAANTPHDSDTTLLNEDGMLSNENAVGYSQNHMISVQRLLPEWLRLQIFLPLSYMVVKRMLSQGIIRPGFLGNVGTVHFARWLKFPRSRNYAFVSNYDGSFESYLEDFVTKVNSGLNATWSHCIGFPKVKNVFFKGSEDGDRFIRWARGSTRPTPFWYSAYPELTVEIIRRNALIRDGLVRARSASDAEAWFDLFDSMVRPEHALQTDQIQNFVFGGSKDLTQGCCLVIKADENQNLNEVSTYFKDFVNSVQDKISYGQKKPKESATYIAVSRLGLDALGVENDRYKTHKWSGDQRLEDEQNPSWFSGAFASGMAHPARKRALGDLSEDGSLQSWQWGESDDRVLGVILLYVNPETGLTLENMITDIQTPGLKYTKIDFKPLNVGKSVREPFGFVDGVSNPIIKGSKRAARNPDSIHLVNPGEFILGYRDERYHFPPSPQLYAKDDINRILPAVPNEQPQKYPSFNGNWSDGLRDLGRNGTYLVIRQLEQNVSSFEAQAKSYAEEIFRKSKLAGDHTSEAEVSKIIADLKKLKIAKKINISDTQLTKIITNRIDEIKTDIVKTTLQAKMMGRWQNGQSLVSTPFYFNEVSFANWIKPDLIKFVDPPKFIDLNQTDDVPEIEALMRDNEYLFGRDDSRGYGCPLGSHVRRTNPRDSFEPGSERELSVVNRHRILRRGRSYIAIDETTKAQTTGTFFMCLNVDIDRQFEFVQQSWVNGSNFHGLRNEYDPMSDKDSKFTIQCPGANLELNLSSFVTMQGGGYFFMPSKDALTYLAVKTDRGSATPMRVKPA